MGGCEMGGCEMGGSQNNCTIYTHCVRAEIVDLNFFSSAVSLLSRALWAITSSCRLGGRGGA